MIKYGEINYKTYLPRFPEATVEIALRRSDLRDEFPQYMVKVAEREVRSLAEAAPGRDRNLKNNWFMPSELFEIMEKPNLRPLPKGDVRISGRKIKKIGRNILAIVAVEKI